MENSPLDPCMNAYPSRKCLCCWYARASSFIMGHLDSNSPWDEYPVERMVDKDILSPDQACKRAEIGMK